MPDATNPTSSAPTDQPTTTRAAPPNHPTDAGAPPMTIATSDFPKEVELWTGRTHWKHFLPRIGLWFLAAVVVTWIVLKLFKNDTSDSSASWIVALLWLVSGAIVLGQIAIRILGHRYRVTTQRLFIERGILSQTIDQTELIRVDDVRVHKTVLDRICGLGTVEVVSTDATDKSLKLVGISRPELVGEHIRNNMRILRNRRGLYVENV